MSAARFMQYSYLAYFSKPRAERLIFRAMRQFGVKSIVELGSGKCELAQRMIAIAGATGPPSAVRYTGVDLFEMRSTASPGLSLRDAYRTLRLSGARVKLVPGDPFAALARVANSLNDSDLLLVRADQDAASMARAWFYVPRMLHARSLVIIEQADLSHDQDRYRILSADEVAALAKSHSPLRRAA